MIALFLKVVINILCKNQPTSLLNTTYLDSEKNPPRSRLQKIFLDPHLDLNFFFRSSSGWRLRTNLHLYLDLCIPCKTQRIGVTFCINYLKFHTKLTQKEWWWICSIFLTLVTYKWLAGNGTSIKMENMSLLTNRLTWTVLTIVLVPPTFFVIDSVEDLQLNF